MAIEQYPNLPGTRTVLRDGGLRVGKSTSDALPRDRILFIGTAVDGPKDTPIPVGSPERALEIFGAYVDSEGKANGANLTLAFMQAWDAGARRISLMRVTGEYATLTLQGTIVDTQVDQIVLRGLYPGKKYEGITVTVDDTDGKLTIAGLSEEPVEYVYTNSNYNTLIRAINAQSLTHGVVAALAAEVDGTAAVTLDGVTAQLADGNDGLDLTDLGTYDTTGYRADLARAYSLLEGHEFDIIVPLGVHLTWNGTALDQMDATKLAEFCALQTEVENPAIGVIGVSQPTDTTLAAVKAYAEGLAGVDNLYTDADGNDLGRYLQIVIGQLRLNDDLLGAYSDDATAAYAGLMGSMERHRSTTNKAISGAAGVTYQLTASQRDALAANGFVTVYGQVGRGVIVTSDRTAAPLGSDYDYCVTVRIATDVVKAIRTVGNPYVGEPMDMPRQNALKGDIDSVLAARKDTAWGALLDYDFKLGGTLIEQIRGTFTVEVYLVPVPTLRRLKIVVSLRAGLGS